ncbi:uncharacterized protein MELLADRAFT_110958 [Melampsora larici-populina 98AG31]|uniref:CxC1-like cysteine cluster associated with KDZ transposases domain-containing protein n=1 Tax=Melampsora larici-populina (strain 98AG31 / pathotype 3-4-7) TaxID=747676 RepID=F4S1K3_MELLP|nr:uncharacterized protein MELLADRAFT_110958 [Melampsora larici-populina 98AG31]EGG01490.1 hypothetical protein MELLADRAFT_110958 [Melampsora larici-populina 98AG31]
MPQPKKQLCSNHFKDSDKPPQRRIKKHDAEAEQQFQNEVKQGAQFLNGILPKDQNERIPPPPPNPNNENNKPHDNLYDQYMPIIFPPIEEEQQEVNAPGMRKPEKNFGSTGKASKTNLPRLTFSVRPGLQTELSKPPTLRMSVMFVNVRRMYHFIWQTSVAVASSFFKGMMNFHDSRVRKPLNSQNQTPQVNLRDLTQPFSSATHLYSRILVLSKCILHHGLQLTHKDIWAAQCGQSKHDVNADPPWCGTNNDNNDDHSSSCYWMTFLICAWPSCTTLVASSTNTSPGDEDTLLELRVFDCLDRFQDLVTQIAEQRRKVGNVDIVNLPPAAVDSFLKVWFAKTKVCRRFLALRVEQWPLDPENKVGGSSRLGTHEKERIMGAIARRTRTMKKTLNNYKDLACAFAGQNPDQPASPEVEYVNPISMEPDDPFWSNGLFTHSTEPWAVDCGTQLGCRMIYRYPVLNCDPMSVCQVLVARSPSLQQ